MFAVESDDREGIALMATHVDADTLDRALRGALLHNKQVVAKQLHERGASVPEFEKRWSSDEEDDDDDDALVRTRFHHMLRPSIEPDCFGMKDMSII